MNIIDEIEKEQIKEISQKRNIPEFNAGDTLKVHLKVVEGNRERIQVFEGMCIARSNRGINSTFTLRKISNGEGVERVFPLHSPLIEKFEVLRKGDVRRAKLYYLRSRSGKKARISEKITDKVTTDDADVSLVSKTDINTNENITNKSRTKDPKKITEEKKPKKKNDKKVESESKGS